MLKAKLTKLGHPQKYELRVWKGLSQQIKFIKNLTSHEKLRPSRLSVHQRNWVAKSNFGLSWLGQLLILQEELLVKKGGAALLQLACSDESVNPECFYKKRQYQNILDKKPVNHISKTPY